MIYNGFLTTFVVLTGIVLGLMFPLPHAVVADDFSQRIIEVYGSNLFTVYAYNKVSGGTSGSDKLCQNVGTAFTFDAKGHLITFNSVLRKAETIQVVSPAGEKMNARVLGCVDSGEVNVLRIESTQALSAPNLPFDKKLNSGTEVVLLSIARGKPIVLNSGRISIRKPQDGTFIIDVVSQPETCGTPVFDKSGDLLGFIAYRIEEHALSEINPSKNNTDSNISSYLVVPLEYAWIIAHSIVNQSDSKCGWLGIYGGLCTTGRTENNGVVIRKVMQNSPAEACGLRENDRVVALNDTPVARPVELIELMSTTKPGDVVTIKILRGDHFITSKATLSSYPTSD